MILKSFHDIQAICEDKKFTSSINDKSIFKEVYIHFESFYLVLIVLLLFTHWYIVITGYVQIGLDYTLHHFN